MAKKTPRFIAFMKWKGVNSLPEYWDIFEYYDFIIAAKGYSAERGWGVERIGLYLEYFRVYNQDMLTVGCQLFALEHRQSE